MRWSTRAKAWCWRWEDLGFEVLPSQANFVFARHPACDAAELAAALRERAVLVRHFKQPRISQHLRISIGTREQFCSALVAALTAILTSKSRSVARLAQLRKEFAIDFVARCADGPGLVADSTLEITPQPGSCKWVQL